MAEGYSCRITNRSEEQNANQRRYPRRRNEHFYENQPTSQDGFDHLGRNINRPICRYFKKGKCRFGERCMFSHELNNKHEEDMQLAGSSRDSKQRNTTGNNISFDELMNAPEFIPSASKTDPKTKSYVDIVTCNVEEVTHQGVKLCPYMDLNGVCSYSAEGVCGYAHGDVCDLCGQPALHPVNADKRTKHIQECTLQQKKEMEISCLVARSKEKTCGVCFEVIMEKTGREQRFGILPNCNHCFCLTCIRKWRQARQFDNKIIRACPECRVTSDFICPSKYWVDTKEDKEKLILDYKGALSRKDCKYFKQGCGKCPFGNKCFYLHALPDGTKKDVGPPPRQPRRHTHEEIDVLQQIILWDILDDRDNSRLLYSIAGDLEDLVAFFSDSEESDWSEYDFFYD